MFIGEIRSGPRREIDVAVNFDGSPNRIAEVLRVEGNENSGRWRQLQRIYCSPEPCRGCPHGDFWYRYRRNKKKKTLHVEYIGPAVFEQDVLDRIHKQARPVVALIDIDSISKTS